MEPRPVRLFRNGANQAVRIPREFELPGREAVISREGDVLMLRAVKPRSLLAVLRSLSSIDDALPEPPDRPAEPVDF